MSSDRSHRWPTTKEIAQEKRVERRVRTFLAQISHREAAITSVRVATQLADIWDVEKAAMDDRGDQRLVYHATEEDRRWLASAVAASSLSPIWWSCRHAYVEKMFTEGLPPDVAAFVAYRIALSMCWKERF